MVEEIKVPFFHDEEDDEPERQIPKYAPGEERHNLGGMIDKFFELKERIEEIDKGKKVLQAEQDQIEYKIIGIMEAEDLDKASCTRGTVTLKQKSMPQVRDLVEFIRWVYADIPNRIGFLHKRVKEAAVNEMLAAQGVLPPGIDTYIKPVLNKRKK